MTDPQQETAAGLARKIVDAGDTTQWSRGTSMALARLVIAEAESSLAERHQRHYSSCSCLGDSAECCVTDCECHVQEAQS